MSKMQVGFKFLPTDDEIINVFLRPVKTGQDLVLQLCDNLYSDKNPWEIFDKNSTHPSFVFARLKKSKDNNSRFVRTAGSGTWGEGQSVDITDSEGDMCCRRSFVFEDNENKIDSEKINGRWLMYEYSFKAAGLKDLVLCKIYNKNANDKDKVYFLPLNLGAQPPVTPGISLLRNSDFIHSSLNLNWGQVSNRNSMTQGYSVPDHNINHIPKNSIAAGSNIEGTNSIIASLRHNDPVLENRRRLSEIAEYQNRKRMRLHQPDISSSQHGNHSLSSLGIQSFGISCPAICPNIVTENKLAETNIVESSMQPESNDSEFDQALEEAFDKVLNIANSDVEEPTPSDSVWRGRYSNKTIRF